MMKRIVALVIVSILLIPSAVSVFAVEEYEHISVTCASSITEEVSTVDFAKKGDQLYISDSDLATFSGFTLSQTSGSGAEFSRSGETVTVSGGVEIDNRLWFPVEESCEKLYVKVTQYGRALIFTGREHTYKELIALTDSIMTGYGYKVIDTYNVEGWVALFGSWLYTAASGEYGKAFTGSYKQDIFNKVIGKVLEQETDVSKFLKNTKKTNKYVKTIIEAEERFTPNKSIDNLITVFGKGITEYEVKDMTEVVDAFLNPIGTSIKNKTGVKLTVLDIKSLVDSYYYVDAVIGCSDVSFNMIDHSYYSNKTGKMFDGLSDRTKAAAGNVHSYHNKTDRLSRYELYFSDLGPRVLTTVGTSGIDAIVETLIDAFTKENAWAIKMFQTVYGAFLDTWLNADAKIDFAEISRMTNDLQNELQEIYKKARKDPALAINAKYVALLYAKYYDIYYDAYEELGSKYHRPATIADAYSPVTKLYACSDSEILDEVKNDKIDIEAITNPKQVEDKPAAIDSKLIGKWISTDNEKITLEFNNDGSCVIDRFNYDYSAENGLLRFMDMSTMDEWDCTYTVNGDQLAIKSIFINDREYNNFYRSGTTPPGGGGGGSGGGSGGGGGSVEGDWVVVDSGRVVEGLLVTYHNGKETIYAGDDSVSYSYRINGDLLTVTHENTDSVYRFEVSGDKMYFYSPDDGELWITFKRK